MATDADAVVVGGGPAGLMAAEQLLAAGRRVILAEAGPCCGRKLLVAGRGGCNLSTLRPDPELAYDPLVPCAAWLRGLPPAALRDWCAGLGVATTIGNGQRLLTADGGSKQLLRAWLARLRGAGLDLRPGHRWLGWRDDGALVLRGPDGLLHLRPQRTILAVGGGSWPRTGSDGSWVTILRQAGITVRDLRPANCGVQLELPASLLAAHAGTPLRRAALRVAGQDDDPQRPWLGRGNLVLTSYGLEGGAVYSLVPRLRQALEDGATPVLLLDIDHDRSASALAARLAEGRGRRSLATHLRRRLRVVPAVSALVHAVIERSERDDPRALAAALKALPLPVCALRPLAEAISSAGGVAFAAVDDHLQLRVRPGVWVAGEMLDWEAPSGGYLLQACLASGLMAGMAAAR